MAADFPFARTLIVLRSQRTVKKTGATSAESRYYLSSAPPQDYTPAQWLRLIRGHWAGVEIRNHWRRDALMGKIAPVRATPISWPMWPSSAAPCCPCWPSAIPISPSHKFEKVSPLAQADA